MLGVNPSFKLVVMVLLFILVLMIHQLNLLFYLTVFLFLLFWFCSGLTWKVKFLLLLPFIMMFVSTASSMILFGKGDVIWMKWGLIEISEESFYRGLHIGFRALLFGLLGLIFTLSTRPVMLFYSLMQQLRLKPEYAYSFMAGFRMIPIIAEEFLTIRRAMKVRGLNPQKGMAGLLFTFRSSALPLLAQSIRRAHRIAVAMEAKRFNGSGKRTYYYKTVFSKYDAFFIVLIFAMLVFGWQAAAVYPVFPAGDVRYHG
ncbi:ABC transporter permease [Rossellomorea aquimaris]|uniref:ABC transporter permease n=2 Tax=Rossellomorea aquimaris TaxID=189382 RepID=A0A1J6WL97_9BACI|nr:ABC transporter permease [Rossellomorea aquimaris]